SAEVGEHCPFAGMGSGGNREHVYYRTALRLLQPRDPLRRVDNRLRVGHAADGSKSSRSGGSGASGNSFLVSLAGLAQVHMQVDEAGSDDQPSRIEFLMRSAARLARRRDLGYLPVPQQDVHGRVDFGGRINEPPAFDQQAVIFFTIQAQSLKVNVDASVPRSCHLGQCRYVALLRAWAARLRALASPLLASSCPPQRLGQ